MAALGERMPKVETRETCKCCLQNRSIALLIEIQGDGAFSVHFELNFQVETFTVRRCVS